MTIREDLQSWVTDALNGNGGQATLVQVAKHIWENHEAELRQSGNLLYTWQYDMRWAANVLRHKKIMKSVETSNRGTWELV